MSRAIMLAIVATLGVIGVAVLLLAPEAGTENATPESRESLASTASAEGEIGTRNAQLNREPLPSLALPLKDALPRLQELAQKGSGTALCRLAAEYQKCSRSRARLAYMDSFARRAEVQDAKRELDGAMVVFGKSSLNADLTHCDGVDEIDPALTARHWRRAALAGNREAMVHYATGGAFDLGNTLAVLGDLQVYKSEAVAIARRAAAQGDGRAVLVLAAAYSPDNHVGAAPLLAQVTGVDVGQSLALYMYADRWGKRPSADPQGLESFVRDRIDSLKRVASADQIKWAEQQAGKMAAEWEAPILPSGSERAFVASARLPGVQVEACE